MVRMANAFIALMMMAAIVEVGICADHIIGAPGGSWDLQTKLSKWASSQKFLAGDNLSMLLFRAFPFPFILIEPLCSLLLQNKCLLLFVFCIFVVLKNVH